MQEPTHLQQLVYILCTATSLLCAILLARGYTKTRARLLLWSCLCFVFLSLNNALLYVDIVLYPETDIAFAGITFAVLRSSTALIGVGLLVFGLVWDSQ